MEGDVKHLFSDWKAFNQTMVEASSFHQKASAEQYVILFYYSFLLVIGNDISPQTHSQTFFFTVIIILGAFFEAQVMGGITSQLMKIEDKFMKTMAVKEYVKFSTDIHKLPDDLRNNIFSYINMLFETPEANEEFISFVNDVNPAINYELTNNIFKLQMKEVWLFEKNDNNHVMYIARLLKLQICIHDEVLIRQGEEGDRMFAISKGSVYVSIKQFA